MCVLDLMLPGVDGWKLIEMVRTEGIATPIVVVSARGTEHDRVHALEIGADDYLVKPFSMKELVARVRAASRRAIRRDETPRGEPIEIEELRIDPLEVQAYIDDHSAELTPTEFRLLYQLALDRGRVVDPRRAAAEALGPPRVAPRPDGRRLRPASAREGRPQGVPPHLHPDALRRGLPARTGAEGGRERRVGRVASPTPLSHRIASHLCGDRQHDPGVTFAVVAHSHCETNDAPRRRGGVASTPPSSIRAGTLRLLEPGDIALARLDVREQLDGIESGTGEVDRLAAGGVDVRNPSGALIVAHDKLLTSRTLRLAGLPHPHTSHIAGRSRSRYRSCRSC